MPPTDSGLAASGRAREARGIQRLRVGIHRRHLRCGYGAALGLVLRGGTLTWLFERGRADANLRSLPDSLGGQ